MREKTYRPRIQNGPVARRRSRTDLPKVSGQRGASRSRAGHNRREKDRSGGNFLWMLMLVGAFVGAGFLFALRSQINIHELSQAETQLRTELDEMANRQRYEIQQQQRALSPRESDRTARQAGLVQPRLNREDSKTSPPAVSRNQSGQSSKMKKENAKERQTLRMAQRR